MAHAPPISIQPSTPSPNPATIIFLHGFGDDAEGWTGLVQQFQAANKLPHVQWILPNAPHNHNAMAQAWFEPHAFSPIPMPVRSGGDGDEEPETGEEEEDAEGQRRSVEYIWGLVEAEVARGVRPERIVVGGFSQGCAVGLLLGLGLGRDGADEAERRVGGVVGLSGYLPWTRPVRKAVAAATPTFPGQTPTASPAAAKFFLAHGTRDQLVPMRIFRQTRERLEGLVGEERCRVRVYEGMGHSTAGAEIRDLCAWLEEVLPE